MVSWKNMTGVRCYQYSVFSEPKKSDVFDISDELLQPHLVKETESRTGGQLARTLVAAKDNDALLQH